jgi:hypothetical protein
MSSSSSSSSSSGAMVGSEQPSIDAVSAMLRDSVVPRKPNLNLFVRDDARRAELERILRDPIAEAARHVVSRDAAANGHRGLPLLDDVSDYPEAVLALHRAATSDVTLLHMVEALLFARGVDAAEGTARILVRELARRDKVELMFALLHVMRQRGVPRDRLLYRSLMFACCKYDDLDWGLYALEQQFHDGLVDVPSMVRLFDSHTANANRRAWHVLDVILLCAPGINKLARWNLATAAVLTAAAHALKLGRSVRARRGFVTLPNPRGEHANPWRHTINGIQTYLEVDARSGHFEVPAAYSPEQLELLDAMLELEDGARLKHWQLGTQSDSMRDGAALLREAIETRQLSGEFADFMLQRVGDDTTRADGLMGAAASPNVRIGDSGASDDNANDKKTTTLLLENENKA